ncbi:MAG TPA: hypothetical protein VL332_06870 [Candidatus Saccharimonadaceae bacterium]|jgi:hypothetical protein|nr:hypothetical protein [Candidatus Saccharimonadaceae bacterium]
MPSLAGKFARFTISGTVRVIVWRSTGGAEVPLYEGVTVREVGADQVDEARSMEDEATLAYLRGVMARGYRMWFAYADGIVVHRSLILPGPTTYNLWHWTAKLDVPAGEGVILGCATHSKYGGRSIYASVLSRIANDKRWSAVWGFTEESNMASRKGLIKAGFHEDHVLTVNAWHGFAKVERKDGALGA